LFPYPFVQPAGLRETLFVLPDSHSREATDALVRLAVRLGGPSAAKALALDVAYAGEGVTEELWKDHHLIVLGEPSENSFLATVDAQLPYPLTHESGELPPLIIDDVAVQPSSSRATGFVELATSPWNAQRTLLAISGIRDGGLALAVEAVLEYTDLLSGNVAIVESATSSNSAQVGRLQVHATDTRPPGIFLGSGSGGTGMGSILKGDELLLAERWWK
jgi:hypothetical protein